MDKEAECSLDTLDLPHDLCKLDKEQLDKLACEIRTKLIETVSVTGGHLASNLGVVELTIGMYCVLNPFEDKIIWDVGHQSYIHKILTGRKDRMKTIRKMDGLSGFPKREESDADCFNTGHSSTSISAALGMARARNILGKKYKVVAVIGDGALTGGMAFEALNDAARSFTDLIIILNDNGMSISKNVGGMSKYLGKISTGKKYINAKTRVKKILTRIPLFGKHLIKSIKRFKKVVKVLFIPGKFFEDLGIKYVGPVEGHNISMIRDSIFKASSLGGPVLIHVVTTKGFGYNPAVKNPRYYHGVTPFDCDSGEIKKVHSKSFSAEFGKILSNLADEDYKIVAITAAMTSGTGLLEYSKKHPEKFYDVGIAEQHAITMAAGMSVAGVKPVVALYSTFLQRAYDQVLHDVALQKIPMVIAVDRAGITGPDGETHQGVYDYSYLNHIPNVIVAAPCCIEEQREMIKMAMGIFPGGELSNKGIAGPFFIRYPANDNSSPDVYNENLSVKFGCANVIKEGCDITIIAIGIMTSVALQAAEILAEDGIDAMIVNARFLKPLDEECYLKCVEKTGCVLTVEDNCITGGFGQSVVMSLLKQYGYSSFYSDVMGVPEEPVPHGTIEQLHEKYGLHPYGIAVRARTLVEKKRDGNLHGKTGC